jgi:Concanavalin A-like lectin/glucanases superfamily/Domain of unknown function (DUF2341)
MQMKKLAALVLMAAVLGVSLPTPIAHATGFTNVGTFTINTAKVPSDQSNFPVEVTGTYKELKTTGNGGTVTSSNGYDVEFFSNSDCATGKLNWETEKWDGTTGNFVYWVKIPTVSHSSPTSFYLCSGNSSVTTDQSNPTGTWDSNFLLVDHMANNAANANVTNSASTTDTGTAAQNTSAITNTGKIDGAFSFNGSSDYIHHPQHNQFNLHAHAFTIEGWIQDDTPGPGALQGDFHRAVSWYDGTDNIQMGLSSGNSGGTRSFYVSSGVACDSVKAYTAVPSTGFHHVVATFDGASTYTMYMDGNASSGSDAPNCSDAYTGDSTSLYLGQRGDGEFWVGNEDEMRISNTARSADWITTEYNNQSSPSTFYSVSGETPTFSNVGTFTINTAEVPSDQSNFPVEVAGQYKELKTTGNGGTVTSSSGYDIEFFSNSDCATGKLNWETEKWDGTTGTVVYWVNIPTVSHSSPTSFYVCSGNSSVTTDQSNPTAVWDSGFKAVYHLPNGTTLSANDSTSNGNNADALNGTTAGSGKIDGAASFDGSSNYIHIPDSTSLQFTTSMTISLWANPNSLPGGAADPVEFFKKDGDFILRYEPADGTACNTEVTAFWFDNTNIECMGGGGTPADGVWHQYTATVSGNAITAFYIDGVLTSTTANVYGSAGRTLTNAATMGAQDGGGEYFNGLLDEVEISSSVRSADWITTAYNNQSSPSTFFSTSGLTTGWVALTSGTNSTACGAPVSSLGAITGAVHVGDVMNVAVTMANNTLGSVTDNLGNTYTMNSGVYDSIDGQRDEIWSAPITVAGTPTVTLKYQPTPGTTTDDCSSINADPFSGSDTSSTMDGATGQTQTTPTTGTDALTSGTYSTTKDGDLIYTATVDTASGLNPGSTGTGFAALTTSSNIILKTAYLIQSSHSAATAGTWTAAANDTHITQSQAFTPAGTGGGGAVPSAPKVSIFHGILRILKGMLFIN